MKEKVSIGLYSLEQENPTPGGLLYGEQLFAEIDNIRRIKEELTAAALSMQKAPPEIVVSVLLIPNWKKQGNSYDSYDYQRAKAAFLDRASQEFGTLGVTVQDFYEEAQLTPSEKAYMHQLEARGSCADLLKTRAMINNKDNRLLIIDSNTKIHNYPEFYKTTFGAPEAEQADALSACLYSKNHINAQNKVVYTIPNGRIAPVLEQHYLNWCEEHKDDSNDKAAQENSIYSRVFPVALSDIGLTKTVEDPHKRHNANPVNLENNPEYRITKYVVVTIQRSWATLSEKEAAIEELLADLNTLPSVYVDGIECNFQTFKHLVAQKYTAVIQDWASRERLFAISNLDLDMKIIMTFYNQAVSQANTDEKCVLVQKLSQLFPTTALGNILTNKLFGCDAQTLLEKPMQKAIWLTRQERMSSIQKELSDMRKTVQNKTLESAEEIKHIR